jgi:hypothetical protein
VCAGVAPEGVGWAAAVAAAVWCRRVGGVEEGCTPARPPASGRGCTRSRLGGRVTTGRSPASTRARRKLLRLRGAEDEENAPIGLRGGETLPCRDGDQATAARTTGLGGLKVAPAVAGRWRRRAEPLAAAAPPLLASGVGGGRTGDARTRPRFSVAGRDTVKAASAPVPQGARPAARASASIASPS